ncbi:helix-turn-helix domain-containing protein [Patescibacteria group bacterium]|nr:helix-turn-helix domain-containing protein [Patescibacteria group bacterium]
MNESPLQQGCPNKFCVNHGKYNDEAVATHDKKHKRLRCRSCGKTWVAHYKSFYYGLRTPVPKIQRAFELLDRGFSIRRVADFVGVSSSTIMRWKNKS